MGSTVCIPNGVTDTSDIIVFDGLGGAERHDGPLIPIPRYAHCMARISEDEYFMAGGSTSLSPLLFGDFVHYTFDRGENWTQHTPGLSPGRSVTSSFCSCL